MKRDVECCGKEDPIQDVAVRMRDRNIGFVPVCDDGGRVLGVVTDRDIAVRVVAEARDPSTPVGQLLSTDEVVSCRPDDDLARAQQQMGQRRKSRLLVIADDGTLRGVISLSDIAQYETPSVAGDTMRQVTDRESRIQ
jgi:CBS domain-containing protein